MSPNHYTQLATLTNINAQSTTWFRILAQQTTNDTNQLLLFGMIV